MKLLVKVLVCATYVIAMHAASPLKVVFNNNFNTLPEDYQPIEKPYTIILYMAADNDLRAFVYRNLEEIKYLLRATPATDHFNIFIHLDVHNPGQKKMTFHLVAYKKELFLIPPVSEMDSGREETLIHTFSEAFKYCPGSKIILGLWNHGTGDLNPLSGRVLNPSTRYTFDPVEQKIVLTRTIGYMDFLENRLDGTDRGICFDDSTHNFLTNQKVGSALGQVCTTMRDNKKIDLLFCDACLMAGIGFIQEIKPWVNYLIASEEVVLATGFRYDQVLNFFNQSQPDLEEFLKYTTKVFESVYQKITPDFTLSSIDLQQVDPLFKSINDISELIIVALKNQKNGSVKNFIKQSGSSSQCTSFDEPSYKDIKHLFSNFLKNIAMIQLQDTNLEHRLKSELKNSLDRALHDIENCIIAHCAGKNLTQSGGISIYLPENRIHGSFQHTTFAQTNLWFALLNLYLAS